jgi:hypothetical protein
MGRLFPVWVGHKMNSSSQGAFIGIFLLTPDFRLLAL